MNEQVIFNAMVSIIGALGGWVLKTMWQALSELQSQDIKLANKVNSIELLVAGKYVTREENEKLTDAVFRKLDRIENKLDGKADK